MASGPHARSRLAVVTLTVLAKPCAASLVVCPHIHEAVLLCVWETEPVCDGQSRRVSGGPHQSVLVSLGREES